MSNPITILIADDNMDDRLSLRDTLESKGYTVFEAADTEETYTKAETELPDLIILDVGMPPEDGYTVCKRLRNNPKTSKTPIMMLTCHGLVEERTTGLYAGADDYVIKPCDNDELLARITALFRRYPPKSNFFERMELAQHSIEAAETYRRNIIVLNIDVRGSSLAPVTTNEEYLRKLVFHDYHTIVEEVVAAYGGGEVAWAGDGGTAEFSDEGSAVAAALMILERQSQHHRLSNLVLRIGIAGGLELLEPNSGIGKRTSQTHNRAGHFQKYSNYNKIAIGKEIYNSLADKSRFQERQQIDGEPVYESRELLN
jgi:DNA-binding response OmpR family regulator